MSRTGNTGFRVFIVLIMIIFQISCKKINFEIDPVQKQRIDGLNIELAKEGNLKVENLDKINELIALSDSLSYSKGKAEAALTGYLILMSEDNFGDALKMIEAAQAELKRLDDPLLAARICLYLGQYQAAINNYELAFDYYLKSAAYFPEHRDTARYTATLRETAALYRLAQNRNMTKKYLHQALALDTKTKSLKGLSIDYDNLGVLYEEIGNMDSAGYFYQKGREIYVQRGVDRLYVYNLNNLASFEMKNRRYDRAEILALRALKLSDSVRRISSLVPVIYTNLGIINRYQNDYEEAVKYFDNALEKSGDNKKLPFLIEMNYEMYQFYRVYSKHEKAYQALDRYHILQDSNMRINNKQNLMALEMKYKYLNLKREEQIKQQRATLILIASIILLIVSIGLLVLLVQRQRIKVRNSQLKQNILDKELESKQRELVSQTLNMVRINEKKLTLIETLKAQLPYFKSENQKIVQEVIRGFETDQDAALWKEFEMRFTAVHTEFYNKLATINPNLTINEKRLCAFLMLDLTTKEISSITGQRPKAIEQARFRLRKQLGIDNPQASLSGFLSSL